MRLIVESGATKTAWRALYEDGTVLGAQSAGLSPTCLDAGEMTDIIRSVFPVVNPDGRTVSEVFFYGAGLVSEMSSRPLLDAIAPWCPFARVHFHSDILAAARALFGDGSGIVAIMGTGSNSCLYSDGKIVRNISPGGYILGDEGSGVSLGRAFLADFIKGMLPEPVEKAFVAETGLDYPQIVRKVYKEPAASAFMASLAPFIMSQADDPYVAGLIESNVEAFISRTLARYEDGPVRRYDVGVTGSFGCACRDVLTEVGARYGLRFVKFLKSPIDELVRYYGI